MVFSLSHEMLCLLSGNKHEILYPKQIVYTTNPLWLFSIHTDSESHVFAPIQMSYITFATLNCKACLHSEQALGTAGHFLWKAACRSRYKGKEMCHNIGQDLVHVFCWFSRRQVQMHIGVTTRNIIYKNIFRFSAADVLGVDFH